jgi:hypothetical protein
LQHTKIGSFLRRAKKRCGGVSVAKAAFAQKCFAGLTVMFLVSCAAEPRYYGPKQPGESVGYTDLRLDQNRFRVTYSGNSATARDMVENFLLMRAAEVTLQSGYSHFLFDARDTKAKTTYLSDFTGWPGWGGGWYWHSWPDAFGGPPFDAQAESRPITKFEASARWWRRRRPRRPSPGSGWLFSCPLR